MLHNFCIFDFFRKINTGMNKPLVLIVDDNPSNLLLLSSILEDAGYFTLTCESGYEAIETVGIRNDIDIILMDVMMPNLDGFEASVKINEVLTGKKEVPIIFITALTDEQSLAKGFKSGAVDYIKKPISETEILLRVKTHLDLKFNKERLEVTNQKLEDLYNKLKASEERYRNLVEQAPDIIYVMKNEKGVYYSTAIEKILGYPVNHFLENPDFWFELIHKEDKDNVKQSYTKAKPGQNFSIEYRIKNSKDEWLWFNDRCISSNIINNELVIEGIATEITLRKIYEKELSFYNDLLEGLVAKRTANLKESEKKFKNIFNSTTDSIYITALNGHLLEVNQTALNHAGITPDKIKAQKLYDIIGLSPDIKKYFKNINSKGQDRLEVNYINNEKQRIFIEIYGKIIDFQDGKAILHVSRDITERKHMERMIMRTIIETEEKERNRFAKDLHDGLGALLSGIKMYVNLIQSKKLPPEQENNILDQTKDLISQAVKNTREIANDLKPHELSRFGLIKSIDSFCEKINDAGKILINFKHDDNIEINDDIELILFRVINELINNTIKHSKAKNANLTISLNNEQLVVKYNDDGSGFDVNNILEADKSGMGLNNIIQRVKTANGTITFKSEKNKGMEATILFDF